MMQQLSVKMSNKVSVAVDENASIKNFESVPWGIFSTLCLNIKWICPDRCKCLCWRESTRERMFKRGYEKFRNEIEITSLVRTIRILKSNTKKHYSRISWRLFKL